MFLNAIGALTADLPDVDKVCACLQQGANKTANKTHQNWVRMMAGWMPLKICTAQVPQHEIFKSTANVLAQGMMKQCAIVHLRPVKCS